MRYSKLALAGFLILSASAAQAQSYDTVAWAPDTVANGTGTGTLSSGSITVTYTTVTGSNAGTTVTPDWAVSTGTAPGIGAGVTNNLGGALGSTSAGQTHTITFSAPVVNPIFLMDYADADTTFNFGATPISFLSSHNASLAGGIVTFPGAADSLNDGFAAQLTGAFGPGTPLVITSTTTSNGIPTQAFTVGIPFVKPTSTPEPGTYALFASSVLTGAAFLRRRKKAKKAL